MTSHVNGSSSESAKAAAAATIDKPRRKAPLHLCTIITEDGEKLIPFVHCSNEGKVVDALQCMGCEQLRSLEWTPGVGGAIACETTHEALAASAAAAAIDPRSDFAEVAARVVLRDVIRPVTTCVVATLSIPRVKELMKGEGLRSVAVVDDDGKLCGLISRTDITRAPDFGCVADMMPPRVHTLPENAPIGHAIALMGFERLSEVPVVTEDGAVVGIFYAVDALRWIAERMGYHYTKKSEAPAATITSAE